MILIKRKDSSGEIVIRLNHLVLNTRSHQLLISVCVGNVLWLHHSLNDASDVNGPLFPAARFDFTKS